MSRKINRPSQLIIIRHGQSVRNKSKPGMIYFENEEARQGVSGIPDHKITLTEEGLLQAEKTGVVLREKYGIPDYVYHSGYVRTEQTLEGILKAYTVNERRQINIRMNQFIRERDPGYAYDMTKEEAEKYFPWLKGHWKTFGGYFSRPVGGESLADVSQRVHTFLNSIFRDRAGKKVWVVTHGGTIRTFRFLLERWNYDRALTWPEGQRPKNCGVTVYNFDPKNGRLILQEYNTVHW